MTHGPNVYACVNLEIQAPAGFQVNTDMDAGWRPKYVEGDLTVLDENARIFVDEYDDGPLRIQSQLVRLTSVDDFQKPGSAYQRLGGLIALGAAGRAAHRAAIDKLAGEVVDIVADRHGDDPVTMFRVKDVVKRYAD